MKNDLLEDLKDIQEVKKQKAEQQRLKEEMSNWEFGKGITKQKDRKQDVRS